jgi:hypothetical protein
MRFTIKTEGPERERRLGEWAFALSTAMIAMGLVFINAAPALSALDPANAATVTYTKDNSAFCNPERGWLYQNWAKYGDPSGLHPPFTSPTSGWDPKPSTFGLNVTTMADFRKTSECITMTKDILGLGGSINSDLPQSTLDRIQADWDEIRKAGMKVVPRVCYSWSMNATDASETIINRHIDQLKALYQKNADVIAWVEGGFIGGCGEGINSTNGHISGELLSESGVRIYKRLLTAVPKDRIIVMRFPRHKWRILGLTSSTAMANVLTETAAYSETDAARLGFASNGYMGDANHYAMFQQTNEKDYTKSDTKYTIFEGEISASTGYNQTKGQVQLDMTWYHQTGLSITNTDAMQCMATWKSNGDWTIITKLMGYRFFLVKAVLPQKLKAGGTFELSMEMTNEGYGRIMNPRNVEIILRNQSGGQRYVLSVDNGKGNRLWLPGPSETKTLTVTGGIPASMPTGSYDVILSLPDPYPSIHERPEYSIRLANTGVWEATTGYNKLNHTLSIDPTATGPAYSGTQVFRPYGDPPVGVAAPTGTGAAVAPIRILQIGATLHFTGANLTRIQSIALCDGMGRTLHAVSGESAASGILDIPQGASGVRLAVVTTKGNARFVTRVAVR